MLNGLHDRPRRLWHLPVRWTQTVTPRVWAYP